MIGHFISRQALKPGPEGARGLRAALQFCCDRWSRRCVRRVLRPQVASVNHTTEIVLVAHLAFHELQQLRPGKMKLSGHESQQPMVQLSLPMTDPSVNTGTAALDHKPQHCVVGLDFFKVLPQQSVDQQRCEDLGHAAGVTDLTRLRIFRFNRRASCVSLGSSADAIHSHVPQN